MRIENPSPGITDYIFSGLGDEIAVEHCDQIHPPLSICCSQCQTTVDITPRDVARLLIGVLSNTGAAHIANEVRRVIAPLLEDT